MKQQSALSSFANDHEAADPNLSSNLAKEAQKRSKMTERHSAKTEEINVGSDNNDSGKLL
jgi:hypothetical protein